MQKRTMSRALAALPLCGALICALAGCPSASDPGDAVTVREVYAGGISKTSAGVAVPGYWKDGAWSEVAAKYAGKESWLRGIAVLGDEVYAGGYSYSSTSMSEPGLWKNGAWDDLPRQGDTSLSNLLYCAAASGGAVYLGGMSRNAAGVITPGYWVEDGTTEPEAWHALTPLASGQPALVRTLAVSGGRVYAGGYSYNASSVTTPGYWLDDGTVNTWHGQTPLDATKTAIVMAIAVAGADVYAAGYCTNASNVIVPGYWLNDGAFQQLTPLDATKSCDVEAIAVSGGDVYIGGYSRNAAGVALPGYWKNDEAFTELPAVDATRDGDVYALAVMGGDVYAGGYCIKSDGYMEAGYWLNGAWKALPSLSTQDARVYSMAVIER